MLSCSLTNEFSVCSSRCVEFRLFSCQSQPHQQTADFVERWLPPSYTERFKGETTDAYPWLCLCLRVPPRLCRWHVSIMPLCVWSLIGTGRDLLNLFLKAWWLSTGWVSAGYIIPTSFNFIFISQWNRTNSWFRKLNPALSLSTCVTALPLFAVDSPLISAALSRLFACYIFADRASWVMCTQSNVPCWCRTQKPSTQQSTQLAGQVALLTGGDSLTAHTIYCSFIFTKRSSH